MLEAVVQSVQGRGKWLAFRPQQEKRPLRPEKQKFRSGVGHRVRISLMAKRIVLGFDVSPLYSGHKVRGIGFYTQRLLEALKKLPGLEVKELKEKAAIKKWDFDLLHIPYFQPYFFSLPFFWKKPLVVTVHDLVPVKYQDHYPPGLKGRLRWEIQKRLLKKVDFILTDSFASKYDLADLAGYPQDRIYPIYLAADPIFKVIGDKERLGPVKKKYRLPDSFVLYVGDVNWNKNIPGLVKACGQINLPLVIVGRQALAKDFDQFHPENKDLVWLQKRAEKNPSLLLLGFVPSEDLVGLYNLASLYCQPSFDEGFGLPVLEAMASGCPVVCSNQGSLPEIAGEAAELVEPEIDDLAQGMKKVLKDQKLRQSFSRLGLEQAKRFSWAKTARETLAVYQLALS